MGEASIKSNGKNKSHDSSLRIYNGCKAKKDRSGEGQGILISIPKKFPSS